MGLKNVACGGMNLTYHEIGGLLGISVTRVQQIEAQALAKMRKAAKARGYSLDDVLETGSSGSSFGLGR
jgi:DNA-directed RNA polymerase sigma subunit (sigma70/sigma32)